MKEKILHNATEMFLNLGFKSVTMDDIARNSGVSKKTIYAHFSNKTDLNSRTSLPGYSCTKNFKLISSKF